MDSMSKSKLKPVGTGKSAINRVITRFKKLIKFFSPKNFGVYICIGLLAMASAYYYRGQGRDTQTINVIGTAYKDVEADWAEWTVCVKHDNHNQKSSLKLLKEDKKQLEGYLIAEGVMKSELLYGQYEVTPQYKYVDGHDTDEISTYVSEVCMYIKSNDVHKIAGIKGGLVEYVVANELTLSSNSVSYTYTSLESDKIALLEEATKNAKERAEALGRIRNMKIGNITYADQGTFNINARNDFSVSWSGNFNTSDIEKTIRATVRVTFVVN